MKSMTGARAFAASATAVVTLGFVLLHVFYASHSGLGLRAARRLRKLAAGHELRTWALRSRAPAIGATPTDDAS